MHTYTWWGLNAEFYEFSMIDISSNIIHIYNVVRLRKGTIINKKNNEKDFEL